MGKEGHRDGGWGGKPLPLMLGGTRGVPALPPPRCLITETHLTLIRYWAKLMLAADPVMVTCLSVDPSTGLAILICAPDIWRISLILAP